MSRNNIVDFTIIGCVKGFNNDVAYFKHAVVTHIKLDNIFCCYKQDKREEVIFSIEFTNRAIVVVSESDWIKVRDLIAEEDIRGDDSGGNHKSSVMRDGNGKVVCELMEC